MYDTYLIHVFLRNVNNTGCILIFKRICKCDDEENIYVGDLVLVFYEL